METNKNLTESQAEILEMMDSPLAKAIRWTRFPDVLAKRKKTVEGSLLDLCREMRGVDKPAKDRLPLLKLGTFGMTPKDDKGCLRHDSNLRKIGGLEGDYDLEVMHPMKAVEQLARARIAAVVYTSPRHTKEKPRWRVLCPLSKTYSPDMRAGFLARLNGVLDGKLAGESFTLSQSFYFGSVAGKQPEIWPVDGEFIDLLPDLDRGAIGRGESLVGGEKSRDGSRSADALRLALSLRKEGKTEEETRAALAADEGGAGQWWHDDKTGDYQRERVIEKSRNVAKVTPDAFDDDPESIAAENDAFLGIEPDPKPLGKYHLDEDGVIRAFTDRHKGELRFDHNAGRWFRFDGNYWRCEETKLAHHYARDLATRLAKRDPKAKALNKVSTWEAVERGARTVREFACTADSWNRNPMLLGTPGGTVDLRTGKVRPGKPDDHISKITAAAPIPLNRFKPERDCPLWLAFLGQALDSDAAAIRFLQQWGGYSLTGDTREQVLLFVYGPGGSGKGTAINTIGDVLGGYSINVGMETLTASKHDRHTTEIARLDGARMARASEAEKGKAWAENRIKTLTGQDTITARFMRQDDFEFTPQFKLTIFANNRPSMTDVDTAMKRRFMILPFDHPPKVKDPDLGAKLKAEWPGILSWLIQGCLDWQANGLVRPPVLDRATESYFHEQDTFGQWLESCCTQKPGLSDTSKHLWDSWHRFARAC